MLGAVAPRSECAKRSDTRAAYDMQRQDATASEHFEHHTDDLALQGMPETLDDLLTLVISKGGDIGHSQEASKAEIDHAVRRLGIGSPPGCC